MKLYSKLMISAAVLGCLQSTQVHAGNPDRAGQAGITQLLVNPWARSSGWGGINIAGISGVESMSLNVAGLSNTKGTEFSFSRAGWLGGSLGININSFGFATSLGKNDTTLGGKAHTISVSIVSFDYGTVNRTTETQPGGLGTFSIQGLNLGFGYSHRFSRNISGGAIVRTVSEGTADASASGLALDAGIQYKAGKYDRTKFGVALRNIGPALQFSGDGLSRRGTTEGSESSQTIEMRSSNFEMPSVLQVSLSYDVISDTGNANKLTLAGTFRSNAFSKDQLGIGAEFSLKQYLQIRAGFVYEEGIFSTTDNTNVYSGPTAGVTLNVPFGKKQRNLGLDYSFRAANHFSGTHTFGVRVNI